MTMKAWRITTARFTQVVLAMSLEEALNIFRQSSAVAIESIQYVGEVINP